jgi:hypothetical protein
MADLAEGGPALALAYFVPVMHALTPILAGALGVPYWAFMRRAMLGGTAWVSGYLILGSLTGEVLRRQLGLLLPLVALMALAVSVIPLARRLRRHGHGPQAGTWPLALGQPPRRSRERPARRRRPAGGRRGRTVSSGSGGGWHAIRRTRDQCPISQGRDALK